MLLLPASGPGWRLALFATGSFVVMAGSAMSGVITVTFRSNYIPAHLLGRVTAATRFVVSGAIPLGAATAGALATAVGTRAAMWALAILFAVTPLPLLATSMRTLRDFPAHHALKGGAGHAGRQGLPGKQVPEDPVPGKNKPESQKEANRGRAKLRAPGVGERPAQELAHIP